MFQTWLLICFLTTRVSSENNSTNNQTFAPPPVESMSRLLPSTTSGQTTTNDTKHEGSAGAASNIELVTTSEPHHNDDNEDYRHHSTPSSSLGLSAYSKFNDDMHGFQPSPFLGVISEQAHVKSYPSAGLVAVGEVFPDTVDKPDPHLGAHKYLYSIEGQQNLHTGHAYHDQVTIQRPAPVTVSYLVDRPNPPTPRSRPIQQYYEKKETTKPVQQTSVSTFGPPQRVPEYPFEIPEKSLQRDVDNFQHVDNSIADLNKPLVPFNDHKPIHEDVVEEKPFRHDSRPFHIVNFPGDGGVVHSPLPHHHFPHPKPRPMQIHPTEDNKWRDALKFFGSLIPIGLLLAAFTPSLIVVNATEAPADATSPVKRTSVHSTAAVGRALDELPASLTSLRLTSCQRRQMCNSLTGLTDSRLRTSVNELLKRSGESYEELLELSKKKQCSAIACLTT